MNQPIPDTTKPNRINRKLKRRWKKTGLTNTSMAAILNPLSPHVTVGIEAPRNGQHARPLSSVVFLCSPKNNAALIRLLVVMVGCIEQPLKRLAGSVTGSFNLIHSATQQLKLVAGGNSSFNGVTA